jgi:hypothetical protein
VEVTSSLVVIPNPLIDNLFLCFKLSVKNISGLDSEMFQLSEGMAHAKRTKVEEVSHNPEG